MRIALVAIMIALGVLVASCGGTSGGRILPDGAGYPTLLGTFAYTFSITSDPNSIVGRIYDETFVEHLTTTSSGKDISAYDGHGRLYFGQFTTTDGDFSVSTDDAFAGETIEFTIAGKINANGGTGTFTLTLVDGFGDDDGAVVTGNWEATKV